jgi:hypothetical protein
MKADMLLRDLVVILPRRWPWWSSAASPAASPASLSLGALRPAGWLGDAEIKRIGVALLLFTIA